MRRKDREVIDDFEIDEIIRECNCIRLGLNDGGRIYIVPLSFGFTHEGNKRKFFFHCADEGRKVDLIKTSSYAAFEMDCGYELVTSEIACSHSAKYKSVIGEGEVVEVTELEEKKNGMNCVMSQNTGKSDWNFPEIMMNRVKIFSLTVTDISCKRRK